MPLTNPVAAFSFNVFMMDAKPGFGAADLASLAVGVGKTVLFGSFSEASGLNAEMETEEYREGGRNVGPHKFVKWGKYPNLVFKRGITMNPDIWDWYYAILYKAKSPPVRKNGIVLLTDRGGGATSLGGGGPTSLGLPGLDKLPVAIWFFRNALPEKLQGPTLNAKSNEIAIETLELAHEGLYRMGPSMIPGIGDAMDAIGI